VKAKKPDPEIYNTARARLGINADRCLVIEDSMVGRAGVGRVGAAAAAAPGSVPPRACLQPSGRLGARAACCDSPVRVPLARLPPCQVGLRAATSAGMHCIITPTSSTEDQPFCEEGAAAVVPQLAGNSYRVVGGLWGAGRGRAGVWVALHS
jgi:beta-phosphoglucomutase-like phosphatase (HAD superfamily)